MTTILFFTVHLLLSNAAEAVSVSGNQLRAGSNLVRRVAGVDNWKEEEKLGRKLLLGPGEESSHANSLSTILDGYKLSPASERWAGKVVYALPTSQGTKYHEKVRAQLETWAKIPESEGRFVVIAGRDYPKDWQDGGRILTSDCEDDIRHISCKEAKLITEGAARGAKWIFIIGEDNYVDTERLEAFLEKQETSSPQAWGTNGCGSGLHTFCSEVDQHGGFCGGAGYALNRHTMESLLANGVEALNQEYNKSWPNDMTTSCSLRQRQIELQTCNDGMFGFPVFRKSQYTQMIKNGFLTLHYVTPNAMRWIHGMKTNDTNVESLAANAFEAPGCELGKRNYWWEKDYKACLENEAQYSPTS